jgi:hypothetical protein
LFLLLHKMCQKVQLLVVITWFLKSTNVSKTHVQQLLNNTECVYSLGKRIIWPYTFSTYKIHLTFRNGRRVVTASPKKMWHKAEWRVLQFLRAHTSNLLQFRIINSKYEFTHSAEAFGQRIGI